MRDSDQWQIEVSDFGLHFALTRNRGHRRRLILRHRRAANDRNRDGRQGRGTTRQTFRHHERRYLSLASAPRIFAFSASRDGYSLWLRSMAG